MPETKLLTFATTDPDEASLYGSRTLYGGRIRPQKRSEGFLCTLTGGRIGTTALGQVGFGCDVTVEFSGLENSYGVSLPSLGSLDLVIGAHEYRATPETAAVIGPVGQLRATGWESPFDRLAHLKFDRTALETELRRMLSVDAVQEIRFACLMDLREGRAAEWVRYAQFLFASLENLNGLAQNPMVAARMSSALMTGLLLATEHQYREALDAPPRPLPPPVIRRAVQYIEENAKLPITVPSIAAAVGASLRTIQRGFSEHLGTTPGAYLARVRMDGAHDDLVRLSPLTTSVAQVASDWGFVHHSRFSSSYRAAYGVLPSHTLRSG